MGKLLLVAFAGVMALAGFASRSTYASSCSAPLSGWQLPGDGWHNILVNRIAIEADGRISWNGAQVSRSTLRRYLTIIPQMRPHPATVLRVHPDADCETVGEVRNDMDEILRCAESRSCGEGEGEWDTGPFVDANSALLQELEERAERAVIEEGDQ